MNKGANIYLLYWNDILIGFNSFLNMPSGTTKYSFRTHRLVILPDFQNLNIGTKFEEFMGEYFLKNSCKMFLRTTHLRLGEHCNNSLKWKSTATNQIKRVGINDKNSTTTQGSKYKKIDDTRIAYSFEYVGENYNTKEHQYIICDGECEKEKAKKLLNDIVEENKYPIIITSKADQKYQTVWEEIAKEKAYRIEVLRIKRKSKFFINESFVKSKFDCILTSKESQEDIKPYKSNMNKCITYDFRKEIPTLWKNF